MFNWFNFISYVVITAGTPGPNNIMSMTNAGRLGFKKSFPFNLGIWSGFSVVMIICTVLSNTLHTLLPAIKLPMLLIGAAYMLYLAWKIFKSSGEIEEGQTKSGFFSGMFLQFINPKGYIYGIVSMEAYILPVFQGKTMVLFSFAIMLSTTAFVFTLLWAVFGSVFKALFSKYAKVTNSIMALLLVYCAVSLFL
ncbi:LysE family transporter [Spirochaetota bacterium]